MKRTYKTNDYSKFLYYGYNREILNELNIQAIMQNMKEFGFDEWNPIIVSPTGRIADGQHRLEAARRLGLDVWVDEYDHEFTADEIRRINKNRKNWTTADYIHSLTENQSARRMYVFVKDCRELGIPDSAALHIANAANHRDQNLRKCEKSTELSPDELRNAQTVLGELQSLKQFIPRSTSAKFIGAFMRAKACDNFSVPTFIKKLRRSKFTCYTNMADLIEEIERVYNFKNRDKITINKDGLKSSRR